MAFIIQRTLGQDIKRSALIALISGVVGAVIGFIAGASSCDSSSSSNDDDFFKKNDPYGCVEPAQPSSQKLKTQNVAVLEAYKKVSAAREEFAANDTFEPVEPAVDRELSNG